MHAGDGATKLETRAASVAFAGLVALQDVTLQLGRGEVLGLIGANGAGKTTLVNVISGFQRPDSGSVWLDGTDVTRRPVHDRARLGLGRTFQAGRLFPRLTVEENIEAAAWGAGLKRREVQRRTAEVLSITGLAHLAAMPAGALPYGEERRVAIA